MRHFGAFPSFSNITDQKIREEWDRENVTPTKMKSPQLLARSRLPTVERKTKRTAG